MDIRSIQNLEFEALVQLQDFCQEHNITFFLRGGSVMGAIKYGGFVPWDDDIDIAVPRGDFNKLISLAATKAFSEKFEIVSYHWNDDARCYFPRVFLRKEHQQALGLPSNNHLGVAILDILPLDGAPETKLGRKFYYLQINLLRVLGSLATGNLRGHKWHRRLFLRTFRLLGLQKLYNSKDIYQLLDKVYSKNDVTTSTYIGTITGSLYSKEIFKRDVWGQGTLVPFESGMFFVPQQFDNYLKKLYGSDYMTSIPSDKAIEFKRHIKDE